MQPQATPTQKVGYIEVKQPSKIKGRKLKSWRRRWGVLTLLNDLSRGGRPIAKLDLFENEAKWRRESSDRVTFVFENVTSVRYAQSRTHAHALEIVERQAVLVLSGSSEVDSYGWMLALQQMLVPSQVDQSTDTFQVSVLPNVHSVRCGLAGEFTMHVTPQHIELVNPSGVSSINWGLSTLARFNSENDSVLTIECGPNSPTGHSMFRLSCEDPSTALKSIRQSICQALILKQNAREKELEKQKTQNQSEPRPDNSSSCRTRTISASVSEKGYQGLLDNTAQVARFDRADSDSSGASLPLQHPHLVPLPLSPVTPTFETGSSGLGGGLSLEEPLATAAGDLSANTLLRNSSHNSIGSISPVVLRHVSDGRSVTLPREQSDLTLGVPGIDMLSSSPTEGSGVGGSPTNRIKRTSDSLCISTPELEAVPEKDENNEGCSTGNRLPFTGFPAPVTFGLGDFKSSAGPTGSDGAANDNATSILHMFDELSSPPAGTHRRNLSFPAADSGYSVIKDVSRERAATVGNDCGTKIESAAGIAQDIPNDKNEVTSDPAHITHDTHKEGQYQEIDRKEDPYSTIGGRYTRRRSSSLSDLQPAKYTSKPPFFENVYEDVDELRETMKKIAMKQIDPPELPARPLSVSFTAPFGHASPGSKQRADTVGGSAGKSAKKKRSLFGKNKDSNSADAAYSELSLDHATEANLPGKVRTCNSPQSDSLHLAAVSDTPRPACGPTPQRRVSSPARPNSVFKTNLGHALSSSTEELIQASDSSSFSELYADIVELRTGQGRRRRSSDITPVKQSLLDPDILAMRGADSLSSQKFTSDWSSPTSGKTPTSEAAVLDHDEEKPPALPQRNHSPLSKIRSQEVDLILLNDNTDNTNDSTSLNKPSPNASQTNSPKISPHQPPPASDPLISFFLDDKKFQDNPLVTGTLSVSRPLTVQDTLAHNSSSFPQSLDSFYTFPQNPFFAAPSNIASTLDNNNNNSSSSSSPVSPRSSNLNDVRGNMSPLNFTNPFTEDLFLWSHTEISTNGHLQNSMGIREGNYLAMSMKPAPGNFPQRSVMRDNIYMTPTEN